MRLTTDDTVLLEQLGFRDTNHDGFATLEEQRSYQNKELQKSQKKAFQLLAQVGDDSYDQVIDATDIQAIRSNPRLLAQILKQDPVYQGSLQQGGRLQRGKREVAPAARWEGIPPVAYGRLVSYVQHAYNQIMPFSSVVPTGVYGPRTAQLTKSFQEVVGLQRKPDGSFIDRATLGAIILCLEDRADNALVDGLSRIPSLIQTSIQSLRSVLPNRGDTIPETSLGPLKKETIEERKPVKAETEAEPKERNGDKITFNEKDIESLSNALLDDPAFVLTTLTNKHKEYYGRQKLELAAIVQRSQGVIAHVKYIFQKEGVPEKYAFLAIPESSWRIGALSDSKAKGLYQFIPDTARRFGGIVNPPQYDDRVHVLRSAELAAKFLKNLNKKFDGDWSLTLAAYNSGMPLTYLKEAKKAKRKISYENYLQFLGERLMKPSAVREVTVTVKENDSFDKILKINGVPLTDENRSRVLAYNAMPDQESLQLGQKIKIPKEVTARYAKLMKEKEKNIRENVNYPPKFLAIEDILEKDFPDYYKTPPAAPPFDVYIVRGTSTNYTVQNNDSLSKLAAQFGISRFSIQQANGMGQKRVIHPNQSLKIPLPMLLDDIARQQGIPLASLKRHNPHVDAKSTLPYGSKVYLPRE